MYRSTLSTSSKTSKEILKHAVLNIIGESAEGAHLEDDRVAVCAIQLPSTR